MTKIENSDDNIDYLEESLADQLIVLPANATFKILFDKLLERNEELAEKGVDELDNIISIFDTELHDGFPEFADLISDLRGTYYSSPKDYHDLMTKDQKTLLETPVLEYFSLNGVEREDLEVFLPISFEK